MGRPGRPRGEPYAVLTINLSKGVAALIREYGDKNGISYKRIVEEAVLAAFQGANNRVLSLTADVEKLQDQLKTLQEEKSRLEKEKAHLEKKVAKLEFELEKLKERWKGQKTLDKYTKRNRELMHLVESILEHIEEGKTWREVMEAVGIMNPPDQIDILEKIFHRRITDYGDRRVRLLVGNYIKDWALVEGDNPSFFNYVFRKVENLDKYDLRLVEKAGISIPKPVVVEVAPYA